MEEGSRQMAPFAMRRPLFCQAYPCKTTIAHQHISTNIGA